jgi:galactose oxidase
MRAKSTRPARAGMLAALAVGLALLAPAAGASASTILHATTRPDAVQLIQNVATSKCLDMTGDSKSDGGQPQLWTCNGNEQQRWILISVGNYYLIEDDPSGLCLSILNNDTMPGGEVIQYTCNMSGGDAWELWQQQTNGMPSGQYRLGNLGDGLDVMQPSGCGTANGTKMFVNVATDCSDNIWKS